MEWVRSVVGLTSVVHRGSVIPPGSQTRDLGNPVYGDSTERIGGREHRFQVSDARPGAPNVWAAKPRVEVIEAWAAGPSLVCFNSKDGHSPEIYS